MGLFDFLKSADDYWQMGEDYFFGKNGVEVNYYKAMEYYEKAYEKGTSKSLVNLVYLYSQNPALTEESKAIIFNISKRDAQNSALGKSLQGTAQNNLASCYLRGYGVEKNRAEAAKWFKLGADNGSAEASYNYSQLIYKPIYEDAQAYRSSRRYMDLAMEKYDKLSPDSKTKIKEIYTKMFETLSEKEMKGRSIYDLYMKGRDYEKGENGVQKDAKEACKWYKAAYGRALKESGSNSYAMYMLSYCLYFGDGCEMDKAKAKESLIKARKMGCGDAETTLYKWFPEQKEEDSIAQIREVADSDNPTEEALIEMALHSIKREEYKKAIHYAGIALKRFKSADGYVIYALIAEYGYKPYKKDLLYAESTYAKAIKSKKEPTHPRLQYEIARFAFSLVNQTYTLEKTSIDINDYIFASWHFTNAAKQQQYYKAYELEGLIELGCENIDEAIELFETAVDNGVFSAYVYLGYIYKSVLGDDSKGLRNYLSFVNHPHDPVPKEYEESCYVAVGVYYQKQKDYANYRKYLDLLCNIGDHSYIYLKITHLLGGTGGYSKDYMEARLLARKLLDDPAYSEFANAVLNVT